MELGRSLQKHSERNVMEVLLRWRNTNKDGEEGEILEDI